MTINTLYNYVYYVTLHGGPATFMLCNYVRKRYIIVFYIDMDDSQTKSRSRYPKPKISMTTLGLSKRV